MTPRSHGATEAAPAAVTARKARRALLLPYQQVWVNDESPRKLGDKSRRTGWTYCEAYDCVSRRWRRTQPRDCDYWFSSADESAAQEFIEYCRFWARELFGAIADRYTEGVEDPDNRRVGTAYCLRTPGERKIVAMTSNPRRFRSKGGDVGLDEFAFHDDARAMYTAAAPVTTWGGTLRVFSTPNGESTEFNALVQKCRKLVAALGHEPDRAPRIDWATLAAKARALHITPAMSYHRVTILDAVESGMVELMNRTRGTKWTREDFLADCREKCLDEEAYQQEYLCTPGLDASAWLTYSLIESCEADECTRALLPVNAPPALHGYRGAPCVIGVDFARDQDLSVIWVLEPVGDVLWTRMVLPLRNRSTPEQVSVMSALLRQVRVANVNIDMTGNGLGFYEYVRREFGTRVHGVHFGSSVPATALLTADGVRDRNVPVTHALAMGIKEAFETRRVRIPAGSGELRDALHKVRKVTTPGGRVTFEAPRTKHGHADEFWGLALAIEGAAGGSQPWAMVL